MRSERLPGAKTPVLTFEAFPVGSPAAIVAASNPRVLFANGGRQWKARRSGAASIFTRACCVLIHVRTLCFRRACFLRCAHSFVGALWGRCVVLGESTAGFNQERRSVATELRSPASEVPEAKAAHVDVRGR